MTAASDSPQITVAICTLNRAMFLERCLEGLAANEYCAPVDILIVDNGSTDSTPDVVESFKDRLQLSYVYEPRTGLSHARNCALALARTEYIVYLDDDGVPDTSWLRSISMGIHKYIPDIFGGPYVPYYTRPRPSWYLDTFGSAHLDLPEGDVDAAICFSGGNMGWRVDLLNQLGGFDPNLGMIGDRLRLGEETALQITLRSRPDLRRVFLPQMSMQHHVAATKMSLRYIAMRSFVYGTQLHLINPNDQLCMQVSLPTVLLKMRFGLPILQKLFWRNRDRFPYWKTYAAQYLSLHMISVGVLWAKLFA